MGSADICKIFLFVLNICYISSQVEEGFPCFEPQLNVTGRCVLLDDCDSAKRDLLNKTKPTLCAITDTSVQMCCRDGTAAEKIPLPKPETDDFYSPGFLSAYYASHLDMIRVSERKCLEMLREVHDKASKVVFSFEDINLSGGLATCAGVRFIIGGVPAHPNEYPHMAAIGWTTPQGEYKYHCGGSLISPKFVMTAAHCTYNPSTHRPEPDIVHLGDHNISPAYKEDAKPIDVRIIAIYKHPEYRPPRRYNDIALLELERTLPFNFNIRPACLWTRDELLKHTYKTAVATGWGVTDTGKTADVLQKVWLSILDNESCDWLLTRIRNHNWWGFAPSQLCAGELGGGKDTCQGDSGGPLMVQGERCMYHVIGVTSFGHKCGKVNRPAIYTRVSSYLDWIESIVWPGE